MQLVYPLFLILILIETLFETSISRKNSAALVSRGAMDVSPKILPWMVFVYFFMFVGSLIEYYVAARTINVVWLLAFGLFVLLAKALKFWVISSLGQYWTMKVLVVPGIQTVNRGPYRWIRHPNYVAVVAEVIALPLMGKAFVTAVLSFVAIAYLIVLRIHAEEKALVEHTDYSRSMIAKRRFIP